MTLTHITLTGTMMASAWGSMLGDDTADMEIDFSMDFLPPNAPESLWSIKWESLRESLVRATESGDLIGGRGDIIECHIVFHLAKPGETRQVYRELTATHDTRDLWA